MPIEISKGIVVDSVIDLIGGNPPPPPNPKWIKPPRLEDTPELPPPGIYFDMPMHIYHSLPALSASGVKLLAASPMIFWGASWMNPRMKRKEAKHFIHGEAYHVRICEGAEAFNARFAAEYERDPERNDIISTVEEIKHLIGQHTFTVGDKVVPFTPVVDVVEEITAEDGTASTKKRKAKREDWVAQLLDIDPDAPLAENVKAQYEAQHAGKEFIPGDLIDRIEMSAMMIERDENIAPYFKNGFPEVTLIWYCRKTGVPMKCRVDYMKVRRMVDLKTYENQRQRAPETAIRWEISSYKYNIPVSVYLEGGREVRALVREHGASAIYVCNNAAPDRVEACQNFALKWAKHTEQDLWSWVFQQKGEAPITRAVDFPMGTVKMVTDDIVRDAKKKFASYAEAMGVSPWLDLAPPYTIADEDVPLAAVEI